MLETQNDSLDRIAAIDVGTNSFHAIIASVTDKGSLRILSREKEMVRLGDATTDFKHISDQAMERGLRAMKRFSIMAKKSDAHIRAIGTSALREAENKDFFISLIEKETGIHIDVITGIEEARLIYVGALHALPIITQKALVIDIGGGSTESVIGQFGKIHHIHSAKLGSLRLTKRFFPDGIVTSERVNACRTFINGELSTCIRTIKNTGFDTVIGCSGTIHALVQMVYAEKQRKIPETLNGITIHTEDIYARIEHLIHAHTTEERLLIPGMEPKRADIIVAGALILEHYLRMLSVSKLLISAFALREGIVFDTVEKLRDINEYHHLTKLRYDTVYSLCELYKINVEHAEHVKKLALQIFDDTIHRHQLGDEERELLEAASLLHDVGYHISPDQHHHHSQYIISHCIMPGFTNDESQIIGMIARYHRKSHPKRKHPGFSSCSPERQRVISILAGMLRIAEGLDRRQQQLVESLHCDIHDTIMSIALFSKDQALIDIEIWGAERRISLLEECLGVAITFSTA
jgi:exopolyphosphatase/guanosine-5'-triphosphate,3'-diphosphate pyrophosphatase